MPLLGSIGAACAKAFGFTSSAGPSLPVNGFISTIASGSYGTNITGVAYDPSGNMYAGGSVTSAFFSGSPVIMKFEAGTGNLLWAYSVSNSLNADGIWSLAYYSGNLYAYNNNNSLLMKISPAGSLIEAKTISNAYGAANRTCQLEIDSSGNIYIFGPTGSSSGYSAAQVTKLNSSYSVLWSRKYYVIISPGSVAFNYSNIRLGADDSISFAGYWDGNYSSPYEPYVITVNSSGTVTSSVKWNSSGTYEADRITDSSGNTYTVYSKSGLHYLVKTNSSGTISWQKSWSAGATSNFSKIQIDSTGNIYLTTPNVAIYKFNNSGSLLWAKGFASPSANLMLMSRLAENLKLLFIDCCDFSSSAATCMAMPTENGPTNGTYAGITISTLSPTVSNSSMSFTTPSIQTETSSPTVSVSNASVTLYSYTPPTITRATVLPS